MESAGMGRLIVVAEPTCIVEILWGTLLRGMRGFPVNFRFGLRGFPIE